MSARQSTRAAAIAGRRIDARDAEITRFPPERAPTVKGALKKVLSERGIGFVVTSAACGADILALEASVELGIRFRIILPFRRERFLVSSVVDRGADWGRRYGALLALAEARGDVVELEAVDGDDDAAYGRATERILEEARVFARDHESTPMAIAVWDEQRRDGGDATMDFLESASRGGFEVLSVSTLPD